MLLLAAYAVGGISPGWWLVRRSGGGDLRERGSGGTGATNAGRVLGNGGFALVLALDAAKGAAAVGAVLWLAPAAGWAPFALPAVIAGHIWPPWLAFKGGRGAGPLLGGALVLGWAATLIAVAVGIGVGLAARKRFLAGAAAYVLSLMLMLWHLRSPEARLAYLFGWTLVLLAHRSYFAKYSKS